MATIKKAQLGGLIKKGMKAAEKVTIPSGLKKSIKKSQSGPTKITPYSSEAERIAAGGPTNLQKYKTVNKFDPDYQKPYKPKKQPKVDKYGFDTRPDRNGGTHKAQAGAMLRQAPKSTMEKISSTKLKDVPEKAGNLGKRMINSGKDAVKNTINKVKNTTVKDAAKFAGDVATGGAYSAYKMATKKPAKKADKVLSAMAKKNGGPVKKKMRNGGSLSGLKASNKRVGPSDTGAWITVQNKALAGAKSTPKLTKDKQLGATKMAKRGMSIKKK